MGAQRKQDREATGQRSQAGRSPALSEASPPESVAKDKPVADAPKPGREFDKAAKEAPAKDGHAARRAAYMKRIEQNREQPEPEPGPSHDRE